MFYLVVAILVFVILNIILTIGIAGSVAKLVQIKESEPESVETFSEGLLDLPSRPSYADMAALTPSNYDGITPQPQNWDGISKT